MSEFNDPNKTLAENATFSSTTDATPVPALQTNSTDVQEQPKNKTFKRILIIILIIVLLAVGILAIAVVKTMFDIVKPSKIKSQNSCSTSLYMGITSSLYEMKENGYKLDGYYIISSDDQKNYNLPDNFNKEDFFNRLSNYFQDYKKYDWFAVIENGEVTYVANSPSWKSDMIGIMPIYYEETDNPDYYRFEGISHDYLHFYDSHTIISDDEKISITKLYDDAKNKIEQKAKSSN